MNEWFQSIVETALCSVEKKPDINTNEFLYWLRHYSPQQLDTNILKQYAVAMAQETGEHSSGNSKRHAAEYKAGRDDGKLHRKNPDVRPTLVNQIDGAMQRAKQHLIAGAPLDSGSYSEWFSYLSEQMCLIRHLDLILSRNSEEKCVLPREENSNQNYLNGESLQYIIDSLSYGESAITTDELFVLKKSPEVVSIGEENDQKIYVSLSQLRFMILFRIQICIGSRGLDGGFVNGTDNYTDFKKKIYNLALMRQLSKIGIEFVVDAMHEADGFESLLKLFERDSDSLVALFALDSEQFEHDIVNIVPLKPHKPSEAFLAQVVTVTNLYHSWRQQIDASQLLEYIKQPNLQEEQARMFQPSRKTSRRSIVRSATTQQRRNLRRKRKEFSYDTNTTEKFSFLKQKQQGRHEKHTCNITTQEYPVECNKCSVGERDLKSLKSANEVYVKRVAELEQQVSELKRKLEKCEADKQSAVQFYQELFE